MTTQILYWKKIKLEHEKIISKIKETNEEIDISEHEVYKFLLIFHTLIETVNSVETEEETDGLVADAILQIVNLIAGLLKSNIDNLTVPAVLKSALKNWKVYSFHKKRTRRRKNRKSWTKKWWELG